MCNKIATRVLTAVVAILLSFSYLPQVLASPLQDSSCTPISGGYSCAPGQSVYLDAVSTNNPMLVNISAFVTDSYGQATTAFIRVSPLGSGTITGNGTYSYTSPTPSGATIRTTFTAGNQTTWFRYMAMNVQLILPPDTFTPVPTGTSLPTNTPTVYNTPGGSTATRTTTPAPTSTATITATATPAYFGTRRDCGDHITIEVYNCNFADLSWGMGRAPAFWHMDSGWEMDGTHYSDGTWGGSTDPNGYYLEQSGAGVPPGFSQVITPLASGDLWVSATVILDSAGHSVFWRDGVNKGIVSGSYGTPQVVNLGAVVAGVPVTFGVSLSSAGYSLVEINVIKVVTTGSGFGGSAPSTFTPTTTPTPTPIPATSTVTPTSIPNAGFNCGDWTFPTLNCNLFPGTYANENHPSWSNAGNHLYQYGGFNSPLISPHTAEINGDGSTGVSQVVTAHASGYLYYTCVSQVPGVYIQITDANGVITRKPFCDGTSATNKQGMVSGWEDAILSGIGAAHTDSNRTAIDLWASSENTTARFNPLATTHVYPGSTNYNYNGGYPVQNYVSYTQGIQATIDTLNDGAYGSIISAFSSGTADYASTIWPAINASVWGTHDYVGTVNPGELVGGGNSLGTVYSGQDYLLSFFADAGDYYYDLERTWVAGSTEASPTPGATFTPVLDSRATLTPIASPTSCGSGGCLQISATQTITGTDMTWLAPILALPLSRPACVPLAPMPAFVPVFNTEPMSFTMTISHTSLQGFKIPNNAVIDPCHQLTPYSGDIWWGWSIIYWAQVILAAGVFLTYELKWAWRLFTR